MKNIIEIGYQGKTFRVAWSFSSINDIDFDDTSALLSEELKTVEKIASPQRVKEFMAGRYCAKDAFALYEGQPISQKTRIGIGAWGYPYIEGSDVNISIAHSDNLVAAVCNSRALPIGIDIERYKPTNDALMLTQVSEAEQKMLHLFSSDSEGLHVLWSAKEAVAKALLSGFRLPIHLFEVSKITRSENVWHIKFDNLDILSALVIMTNNIVLAFALSDGSTIIDGVTTIIDAMKNIDGGR